MRDWLGRVIAGPLLRASCHHMRKKKVPFTCGCGSCAEHRTFFLVFRRGLQRLRHLEGVTAGDNCPLKGRKLHRRENRRKSPDRETLQRQGESPKKRTEKGSEGTENTKGSTRTSSASAKRRQPASEREHQKNTQDSATNWQSARGRRRGPPAQSRGANHGRKQARKEELGSDGAHVPTHVLSHAGPQRCRGGTRKRPRPCQRM